MRRIAAGSMGEVWEADDTVPWGAQVAIKLLAEELAADPHATRRFVREARATARLAHPNVARVYDFGRDGGVPFLVMELLEGDPGRPTRLGAVPAGRSGPDRGRRRRAGRRPPARDRAPGREAEQRGRRRPAAT